MLFECFDFDGKTVAVPAWNKLDSTAFVALALNLIIKAIGVFTFLKLNTTYHIFQYFVQGMADMKTTIRIWWSIM
jgi:hypothetical protein